MPEIQHMKLWDKQFQPIWDSDVAVTPAYRHIDDWVHAVIDFTDGVRWTGLLYRCPEGVTRWPHDDLTRLNWPVNPILKV